LGRAGDPRLEEDNRVVIPGGRFRMGAQKRDKKAPTESPVHEVVLRPFRIGKFPVTVQEYADFMAKGGYSARRYWREGGFGQLQEPDEWERQKEHPNRPVVGVSWFEAAAYCAWAGGRLPTEAEWERAARGPKGSRYPWGDEPSLDKSRANYAEAVGHTTPVGLYPKGNTTEGLCDMLGNVWEWCSDWFGEYEAASQENPVGPDSGKYRVVRGGLWYGDPVVVRVSSRVSYVPSVRSHGIGFRWAGELR
jgi:formylglycine-generating enzyme required for sulfatase activity